jgi:hypothetical protein
MKYLPFIVIGFVILVGVGTYFLLPKNAQQPLPIQPPDTVISSGPITQMPSPTSDPNGMGNNPTTLVGEITCLPHKDTSGPQTMECAFGLKTHEDVYYALDLNKVDNGIGLQTDKRVIVTGLLTPVEALSSDHWQKYNMKGIISVDSVKYE